jgi:peptidoglycan/xylan/chitin deacetylase (PgdA/CDA1 family)
LIPEVLKYPHLTSRPVLFIKTILLFAIVCLGGCNGDAERHDKSGIAISFDDHFIKEWYQLRPLFQKYNAKVTFFITCPDSVNAEEANMLRQLQKDGHEIGYHGTIHGKSTELIAALGPEKYAATELEPGLRHLAAAGFNPTSYAHPGGNHNDQVDSVLLAKGFKILRDVAVARRKLSGHQIYAWPPRWMSSIFYKFDGEKEVDALLIDVDEVTDEEMADAIAKAKEGNTALMIFGHEPLYGAPQNGEYGFNVSFLANILKEAHRQGLKFYTMSELPQQK